MPRLPQTLVLRAYKTSPLLYLVLQGARTLESATNELRWLTEHNESLKALAPPRSRDELFKFCQRRSRAEPLQYILGSQPFGALEIKCHPGVLIPRPETEAYTTYLAKLLCKKELHQNLHLSRRHNSARSTPIRIIDICSGSGCIALLLHNLLSPTFTNLKIFGLDISPQAVALANTNLHANVKAGHLNPAASKDTLDHPPQVQFHEWDILSPGIPPALGNFDIMISNPPYISSQHYVTETARSVRNYEPRLALVPSDHPDMFYKRLIKMFSVFKARILVMEIGDVGQAVRVAEIAAEASDKGTGSTHRIEIWRDDPEQEADMQVVTEENGREIRFRGQGKVRAVVLFRSGNSKYRGRKSLHVADRLSELHFPSQLARVVKITDVVRIRLRRSKRLRRARMAGSETRRRVASRKRSGLALSDQLPSLRRRVPLNMTAGLWNRAAYLIKHAAMRSGTRS